MYTLKNKVMIQKDYRIGKNETVADFILRYEKDDLKPEDTLSVVAVDGVPFELNMSASIILETLLSGKSCEETADVLSSLFNVDHLTASKAVEEITSKFIEINIIETNG